MGRRSTTRRGPLPRPQVRADDPTLTRFAGILPFIHFCEALDLPALLQLAMRTGGRRRRHPFHRVLFAFLVASALGTERLAHLDWFDGDALLLKLLRLSSWPVRKVFSGALAGVEDGGVAHLRDVITSLGMRSLGSVRSAVLDFDSTVAVSFGEHEGAVFGYCGKGRNRRRHFPLVASVAQTRAVVNATYRDGSGIDEDETIAFFEDTVERVRARGGAATELFLRADAGFWSAKVCGWMLEKALPFACALPLAPAVKLLLWKASFQPVEGEEDIQVATLPGKNLGYDPRVRVVVLRRRVHDPKAPPPGKVLRGDSAWRYQAIVTSLDWDPVEVWRFYNDRGDAERVFKVGKHALSLGLLVGHELRANETAFLLRLLAFNADVLFQADAERKAKEAGRPALRMGLLARQPRLYRLAGRLLREHNRWVLRVPSATRVAELMAFYAPELMRTG